MGLIKEFKEFIARGNVLDMAVGVVIGAAFKAIVDALVDNIINPLIGLLGTDAAKGLIINVGTAELNIGNLISAVINFLAIAVVLFIFVKVANKFRRKKEEEPAEPAAPTQEELLTEIRDLLKK